MKTRDALIRKFAVLRPGGAAGVASSAQIPAKPRAAPGQTRRRRLTFRLDVGVLRDLQILKVALGVNVNRFCEDAVAKVAVERLAEVKTQLTPEEWDVIVRVADGTR
jgi:hypothetical protein